MPRLTITINQEQEAVLDEKVGDDGEYESKSEAVRHFIQSYEEYQNQVDELRQKITVLESQIEELKEEKAALKEQHERETAEEIEELQTEVERLKREKRTLLDDRQEHAELVKYVEDEISYREAPLTQRLKWWLWGKDNHT